MMSIARCESSRPEDRLLLPWLLVAAFLAAGCAGRARPPLERPFVFGQDTFSYANELIWEYRFGEETGEVGVRRRQPPPNYSHHCFVVARSARQFFQFAEFDPFQPRVTEAEYRRLSRAVLERDPARDPSEGSRVVIPGYRHLSAFSHDHEAMLKELCGGSWQSYFQRGHWRMILPFSRGHQSDTARKLMRELDAHRPPVVHLVRFPSLRINHAVMVVGYTEGAESIEFDAYDPNSPGRPRTLTFERETGTFHLPRNEYYLGGALNLYVVYDSWFY